MGTVFAWRPLMEEITRNRFHVVTLVSRPTFLLQPEINSENNWWILIMFGIKRIFTSLQHGLSHGESSPKRQQQPAVPANAVTQQGQEPFRPNNRRKNERGNFLKRFLPTRLGPSRSESVRNGYVRPSSQDPKLQFAIELSKASPKVAEEMRRIAASERHLPENPRELRFALELSLASSDVAEEMQRVAASEGEIPENLWELRRALELSMPTSIRSEACIKAFGTIKEGHNQFFRGENPSLKTFVEDQTPAEPIPAELISAMEVSPADQMYSAMRPSVRRFRAWATENGLEIVPSSSFNNNCMLHALMKHASGNYSADFRDEAIALKAELVKEFPDEVENERAMLPANTDSALFDYVLQKINKMFNTNMEVCVVQAGINGLPIMQEQLEDSPGKTPVVLFNSGAHYEAIVARR